ncbi:hypothetical protein [Microcoleus sp. herbarium12]
MFILIDRTIGVFLYVETGFFTKILLVSQDIRLENPVYLSSMRS